MNYVRKQLLPLFFFTTVLGSALVWSGYQFAKVQGLVGTKFSLQIQTDSGADLFQGMKVTYKGFRLGKLAELELTSTGQVVGRIDIQEDRASFFTKGAILKLSKEKIITTELVLIPSQLDVPQMLNNGSIAVVRDSVASDLANRIEPLLTKVNLLLEQLADPRLGVQATLTQSRSTMYETTQLLKQITDPEHGLTKVMDKTRDTMSTTQVLIDQLNNPKSGVLPTLDNANNLMIKVDGAINDVEQAPIYRWLIPKSKPEEKVISPAQSKD
jgi:ABC-type transporter Mla subunit MlaD